MRLSVIAGQPQDVVRALLAHLFLLFLGSGLAAQPEAVFGLSLAYPLEAPIFREEDSLLRCKEDEYVRLQLRIDESGTVASILLNGVVSDTRLREYTTFFQRFRFQPGSRNGAVVEQKLPVTLYLFTDHRSPVVTMPITAAGRVDDPGLYWQALELNGVTLPHLRRFPSYHSTISGVDTTTQLRYVLASVDLNRWGVPSRINLARTNYEAFAGQILNAINWGKYSAAKIDSQSVASTCFLLVTFFPSMQYPCRPVKVEPNDTVLSVERLAVRLLPDTLGDLSGPIPRSASDWTYPLQATPGSWKYYGIFRYKIDVQGNAYLVSGGNGSAAAWQFGSSLAASMRFYPAVNKYGYPTAFEGAVKVTPNGKSNVRVKFLWLQ